MKEKTVSVSFMLMGILFCVCLISANLLATKQIMFGPFNITAGILVFPISYIVNDCIVEVWGFNKAKFLIWTGFLMNFLFVFFGYVADLIPGAPYWNNEEGFHNLFGLAPRVAAASFLAFLSGSFLNAYVMSVMKVAGKAIENPHWLRSPSVPPIKAPSAVEHVHGNQKPSPVPT